MPASRGSNSLAVAWPDVGLKPARQCRKVSETAAEMRASRGAKHGAGEGRPRTSSLVGQ